MIELHEVHKKYQMGQNLIYALRGISLVIEPGEFVAIMGPSGSGKSTLMHVMGLLDVPDSGSFKIENQEVAQLSEDDLAILRRKKIGFIFQQFNLLPRKSALENVALPQLYSNGKMNWDEAKVLLEKVGLGDRIFHQPNEMSGGQQQRAAIARSLINHPQLILADEPTGNLDSVSEKEIMSLLLQLNNTGITVVIVTHEEEIGQLAKRIIRMRDGSIVSDERKEEKKWKDKNKSDASHLSHQDQRSLKLIHVFRWGQHFFEGIKALYANKVRTALSMLGILIGVGAVVTMVALGKGAQKAIEDQLSSLGTNLLILRAGAVRGIGGAMVQTGTTARLAFDDVEALKEKIPGIKDSSPNVTGRAQVTYRNKNWNTSIMGVGSAYASLHSDEPTQGHFFSDTDNHQRQRVAVIGKTLVHELFNDQNPLGEIIKLNKISFQVIGVLPEKGSNGWQDQDDRILIPVITAMRRLFGKEYVDMIDIEVKSPELTKEIEEQVVDLMLNRHRIPSTQKEDAFQVRNMADIQEALSTSTRVMTLLLSIIAAISLLVGGIGIMNIMLVSVTERTREVGLRKAVGAQKRDIMAQFLVESMVISGVGGLLGILLGWLASVLLSALAGWATTITFQSVLLSFFFSSGVGIVFGLYPARKASHLAPIVALRYE